ncbi:carbohydrate kinase family protein [Streptomyces sp. NPDC002276]
MTSRRVVGLGLVMADLLVRCSELPGPETDPRVGSVDLRVGGATANVLTALRCLGFEASLAGVVGDDQLGRFLLDGLAAAGVDARYVTVAATGSATCMVLETPMATDRSPARTLLWHLPAGLEDALVLDRRAVDELVAGACAVHVNGRFPEAAARLCEAARAAGRTVSLNIGRGDVAQGAEHLVPYAEVLVVSDEWARTRTGLPDPAEACRALAATTSARLVSVTAGAGGSWTAAGRGLPVHTPAAVPAGGVVTTVGAGDAYHAGLLAAHLSGLDPVAAARRGAAEAARHCAAGLSSGSPAGSEPKEWVA